jgi:hypothetical protein
MGRAVARPARLAPRARPTTTKKLSTTTRTRAAAKGGSSSSFASSRSAATRRRGDRKGSAISEASRHRPQAVQDARSARLAEPLLDGRGPWRTGLRSVPMTRCEVRKAGSAARGQTWRGSRRVIERGPAERMRSGRLPRGLERPHARRRSAVPRLTRAPLRRSSEHGYGLMSLMSSTTRVAIEVN